MKTIYITKDGQIGNAEDLLIVKNLSDNRVEILNELPANKRQRTAFDFADQLSDATYYNGNHWKTSWSSCTKAEAWDWLTNNWESIWNSETTAYDIYRNGLLVDDSKTRYSTQTQMWIDQLPPVKQKAVTN
jgi:hypothetical protein